MPKYRIEVLDARTRRQLDHVRQPDFGRIVDAILKLEDNPRPAGSRKPRGLSGWRIRVGSWRVIYHVDDAE